MLASCTHRLVPTAPPAEARADAGNAQRPRAADPDVAVASSASARNADVAAAPPPEPQTPAGWTPQKPDEWDIATAVLARVSVDLPSSLLCVVREEDAGTRTYTIAGNTFTVPQTETKALSEDFRQHAALVAGLGDPDAFSIRACRRPPPVDAGGGTASAQESVAIILTRLEIRKSTAEVEIRELYGNAPGGNLVVYDLARSRVGWTVVSTHLVEDY
jgi:hypothetical protein